MREPGARDAVFHPHLSLSLSSLRRTRWNSLDGRKKGLTSQIMPTEHGNAFRFEERLGGHLASLALCSAAVRLCCLSVCLSTECKCLQRGMGKRRREERDEGGRERQTKRLSRENAKRPQQSRAE